MNEFASLNTLDIGEKATVRELKNSGTIRRRLLDIGLTENASIECVGKSPSGDPCAYLIRGAVIAIRCEDCKKIYIKDIRRCLNDQ